MAKISVDAWGTILSSSPAFKQAKNSMIMALFNLPEYSERIDIAFEEIKTHFNYIIERTGYQPSRKVLFDTLYSHFCNGKKMTDRNKKFFYEQYQNLAVEYSPHLYDEHTRSVLTELSTSHKLILSSNTMFINGNTLRLILRKLGIYSRFSKFNFSDELGVSKPNPRMYGKSEFHIGDNRLTDFIGAGAAGSIPLIINSNNKTIKDVYNEVFLIS